MGIINHAAKERADAAHRNLVNFIAKRIKRLDSMPRCNQFIDLAVQVNGKFYIFEMKSLTIKNARSQVRRGLSQLYEYQYMQNKPNAILVLVLEKKLPTKEDWMQEYLEQDRQIRLLWNENGDLSASANTRQELEFLW